MIRVQRDLWEKFGFQEKWSMVDGRWSGQGKSVSKFGLPKEIIDRRSSMESKINGPDCFKLVINGGDSSMGLGKV
jgi:hypothetical protein